MKRQVQAKQRICAACIQIPRRIETLENNNLDVISLQGIHNQPVVLLTRLKDNNQTDEPATSPAESRPKRLPQAPLTVPAKKQKLYSNCPKEKNEDTHHFQDVKVQVTPIPVSSDGMKECTRDSPVIMSQENTQDNTNRDTIEVKEHDIFSPALSQPSAKCPSEFINTIKDVMRYSNNFLLSRCGTCAYCDKVEMALNAIATLKIAGFILPNDLNYNNILAYVDLTKEDNENLIKTENSIKTYDLHKNPQRTLDVLVDTPASTSSDEVLPKKKPPNTKMQDAPIFRPTLEQFEDPMKYLESILPEASKFGLCKVIPPKGFKPPCKIDSEIRFGSTNQYLSRMFNRWGPAAKELSTIRAHLASQKVLYKSPPLLEGREINLRQLFFVVQKLGGLKNVFTKKKWNRVAEELRYINQINAGKKLEQVYEKYLLSYEALTDQERKTLIHKVNTLWNKRLQQQQHMFDESDSSEEDDCDSNDDLMSEALSEIEDCITSGRAMSLKLFKKVAENILDAVLQSPEKSTESIEKEYWRHVAEGIDHVCVYAASIDTGVTNLGFPNDTCPYSKHPWNLKRLSENSRNILSFLGPVVGMTVPTLHLSMVFTTSCWHRDPHGLPWMEYMHEGIKKVWYGIPDSQSDNLKSAVQKLCPTFCQNKSIWLPSDITMIPPELLQNYNISMCRVTQEPGEYIIVCPKAYSCSFATNYTVSESVYFATKTWLDNVQSVYQELRDSCEPTMFSFEQLLMSFTKDPNTPFNILNTIRPALNDIITSELTYRKQIYEFGFPMRISPKKEQQGAWNARNQNKCFICRRTLYLSLVRGIPWKKNKLCLEHALKILKSNKKCQNNKKDITFEVLFSSEDLMEVLKISI